MKEEKDKSTWKLISEASIGNVFFFGKTTVLMFFTLIFLKSFMYLVENRLITNLSAHFILIFVSSGIGLIFVILTYGKDNGFENIPFHNQSWSLKKTILVKIPSIIMIITLTLMVIGWYILMNNWDTTVMLTPLNITGVV